MARLNCTITFGAAIGRPAAVPGARRPVDQQPAPGRRRTAAERRREVVRPAVTHRRRRAGPASRGSAPNQRSRCRAAGRAVRRAGERGRVRRTSCTAPARLPVAAGSRGRSGRRRTTSSWELARTELTGAAGAAGVRQRHGRPYCAQQLEVGVADAADRPDRGGQPAGEDRQQPGQPALDLLVVDESARSQAALGRPCAVLSIFTATTGRFGRGRAARSAGRRRRRRGGVATAWATRVGQRRRAAAVGDAATVLRRGTPAGDGGGEQPAASGASGPARAMRAGLVDLYGRYVRPGADPGRCTAGRGRCRRSRRTPAAAGARPAASSRGSRGAAPTVSRTALLWNARASATRRGPRRAARRRAAAGAVGPARSAAAAARSFSAGLAGRCVAPRRGRSAASVEQPRLAPGEHRAGARRRCPSAAARRTSCASSAAAAGVDAGVQPVEPARRSRCTQHDSRTHGHGDRARLTSTGEQSTALPITRAQPGADAVSGRRRRAPPRPPSRRRARMSARRPSSRTARRPRCRPRRSCGRGGPGRPSSRPAAAASARRVPDREQLARPAVVEHPAEGVEVAGQHRRAGRHRLDQDDAEALAAGVGRDVDVDAAQQRAPCPRR